MGANATIPLSVIRPAGGTVTAQSGGAIIETPVRQWTYGAQAEFYLPGIEDRPRLVTVALQVESGILGVGWLKADQSGWVARHSIEATGCAVEVPLTIPAGTRGGKLVFDNWTADDRPARAM